MELISIINRKTLIEMQNKIRLYYEEWNKKKVHIKTVNM